MKLVFDDASTMVHRAAAIVADAVERAVRARGTAAAAFSGGTTPATMLTALAELDLPWARIHVFQVDERAAPDGHPDRNLTMLRTRLLDTVPLPAANAHPMPVTGRDLDAAAARYAATLAHVCGDPPVLDLVHLGLGSDGHTASLVPKDPVLHVTVRDVAATRPYQGYRRLTLTYPALNRARRVLWLVSGPDKADALARLLAGDAALPAGRVARSRAIVVADVEPALNSSA